MPKRMWNGDEEEGCSGGKYGVGNVSMVWGWRRMVSTKYLIVTRMILAQSSGSIVHFQGLSLWHRHQGESDGALAGCAEASALPGNIQSLSLAACRSGEKVFMREMGPSVCGGADAGYHRHSRRNIPQLDVFHQPHGHVPVIRFPPAVHLRDRSAPFSRGGSAAWGFRSTVRGGDWLSRRLYGQTAEGAPLPNVISVEGLMNPGDIAAGCTELGCHPADTATWTPCIASSVEGTQSLV